MEERSRNAELVDDVGDASTDEEVERVVVCECELQHPAEHHPQTQTAEAKLSQQTVRSLASPPPESSASSPRITISPNLIITHHPIIFAPLPHSPPHSPNAPLNEIRPAQEVARPPALLGHDHRAFLFVCHVFHLKPRSADVSYSTPAEGRARPGADFPARYHAAGARWTVPTARSLYGSIDTCYASQPGGFRPCGRLQACRKPQAGSHDLSLILARVFCASLTSIA